MKRYHVEAYRKSIGWQRIPFAESTTRAYCDGWVDCMDSMYPSPPMRIVCIDGDKVLKVIRETKGRAAVHTNSG